MPENNMPASAEGLSRTAEPASVASPLNANAPASGNMTQSASTLQSTNVPNIKLDDNAPNDTATPFAPLLTTYNWNVEWKELQKARRHADDAGYWDKRSATFGTKDAPNPYVERFLELAQVKPSETVFDMGCGTGALTVPLGLAGHRVIAADFSSGMLGVLQGELDAHNIKSVTTKQMSWEDDWQAHGVGPKSADVCMASRSIAVDDLEEALLRLNDVARRRVCITLATGSSPRTDERILAELGLEHALGRDYLYAFNILAANGIHPEVTYIKSKRFDTYESFEDAHESLAKMVNDASTFASNAERACAVHRLHSWLENNLVENEREGLPDCKGIPEKPFKLKNPRIVTWAFIAWDK